MDFTIAQIIELIKPELFILIPVIWYIGTVLKRNEQLENRVIPFILLATSVALSVGWFIVNGTDIVKAAWSGIVQGVLIAMIADYMFNLKKNGVNKRTLE